MSDLIAVGFKGEHTADQVINKLRALQKEYLIGLEDSCVVVRDQAGKALRVGEKVTELVDFLDHAHTTRIERMG